MIYIYVCNYATKYFVCINCVCMCLLWIPLDSPLALADMIYISGQKRTMYNPTENNLWPPVEESRPMLCCPRS